MSHDPVRVSDTRAWLKKALQDLGAGEVDLRHDPAFNGDAMFHAQQAAEKAMKAFLAWHDEPFRKTHQLEESRHSKIISPSGRRSIPPGCVAAPHPSST
ncbi:MAG: HEPN domain-containing protein [Pseudomonadota bacterium]